MYESFFNLTEKPFSLLPDPAFLYCGGQHAAALVMLEYGMTSQAGFSVVTGPIGSGKTTLVRAFLGHAEADVVIGLITNTHGSFADAARWALMAFGCVPRSQTLAEAHQELAEHLISEYGQGRRCILIVDEAQNLSIEALEEFRLLSNINSGRDMLLQIVLVGQSELLEKLKRPDLHQFAQRVVATYQLAPLPYPETRQYIQHRLRVAGATRALFTEMALGAVHYFSGGVPRLINLICDLALVYAFADGRHEIDADLVFKVVSDRQSAGIAPFAKSISAEAADAIAEIAGSAGTKALAQVPRQEAPGAEAIVPLRVPAAAFTAADADFLPTRGADGPAPATPEIRIQPLRPHRSRDDDLIFPQADGLAELEFPPAPSSRCEIHKRRTGRWQNGAGPLQPMIGMNGLLFSPASVGPGPAVAAAPDSNRARTAIDRGISVGEQPEAAAFDSGDAPRRAWWNRRSDRRR